MIARRARLSLAMLPLLALVACEVGPDYHKPDAPVAASYKETQGWRPAQPKQAASDMAWWSIFEDPVLDQLESQVAVSNQTLKADEAAYREAQALVAEARAGLYPTITLNGTAERAQASGVTANAYTAEVEASWTLDVWGSIRRDVEAEAASAQASAATLAAATLSAQGTLAADYFALRVADEKQRLLQTTTDLFQHSLEITQNKYEAGTAALSDVASAQAQLESTRAQAIDVGVQRQQLEHAIAVLIGKPPSELTIAPVPLLVKTPAVPTGLPSDLLERRPDIAEAERNMASANASIGVAVAAFYPEITLSPTFGYTAASLGPLFTAPYLFWSIGPSLAQTVFDGGLLNAELAAAKATYQQEVALYRGTVLTAFQQVEDNVSALKVLEQEADVQAAAVRAAQQAAELALNQYEAGTVDYTTVITAQANALTDEEASLTILDGRAAASVGLVQALGGGWDVSKLPAQ